MCNCAQSICALGVPHNAVLLDFADGAIILTTRNYPTDWATKLLHTQFRASPFDCIKSIWMQRGSIKYEFFDCAYNYFKSLSVRKPGKQHEKNYIIFKMSVYFIFRS